MRFVRIFLHRLQTLLRRSRAEANLQREIGLHLEQLTKEYTATGMSEAEARLTAQREFGPIEAIKEHCRDMRRTNTVEDIFRDLAYAFRLLRKSPGLTVTVVFSLTVGIEQVSAFTNVVNRVLSVSHNEIKWREKEFYIRISELTYLWAVRSSICSRAFRTKY